MPSCRVDAADSAAQPLMTSIGVASVNTSAGLAPPDLYVRDLAALHELLAPQVSDLQMADWLQALARGDRPRGARAHLHLQGHLQTKVM